ncbi:MAG: hypothetical protein QOD00_553 [Blastocatellia bacterium]|jgi:hypothetical protein|nr:hypothetical protein [Blastocatellia bacterium]
MYCPKCSQQQLSESVRFCSRCGFALGPVVELLNGNEVLAAREAAKLWKLSLRHHKGTRIGAKLLFFSIVLMPLAIGLSAIFDSPAPLLIPLTVFLAGMTQIMYVRLFGESALPEKRMPGSALPNANERRSELPSTQEPAPSLIDSRPINTAEIVQPPPSVTERTTVLIKNK